MVGLPNKIGIRDGPEVVCIENKHFARKMYQENEIDD